LGKDQNYRELGSDPEYVRRRRVTANKILNITKAALNRAYFHDKDLSKAIRSDEPWRRVKPWPKVEKPVIEYLSVNEQKRLVNACGNDFRALVQAALLTGCRYGELSALTAKDYNPDGGTVYIRHAKAGKERHVFLTDEAQAFFERQIVDKARGDLIFRRLEGEVWKQWGVSNQRRRMMQACEQAKIDRPIRFHDLRHTYASRLATQGVPLAMIAEQLGHSDTRITERNYSHLAKSVVADTVRAAFGKLGIVEPDNVSLMKGE
jgi:integrase